MKIRLNQRIIERQGLTPAEIEVLYQLHELKQKIYSSIEAETDVRKLPEYAKQLTELEFKLQKAWKFKQDSNFHRFWETPPMYLSENGQPRQLGNFYVLYRRQLSTPLIRG